MSTRFEGFHEVKLFRAKMQASGAKISPDAGKGGLQSLTERGVGAKAEKSAGGLILYQTKFLHVNGLHHLLAVGDGGLFESLTAAEFLYDTGFSNLRLNFLRAFSMLSPSLTCTIIIFCDALFFVLIVGFDANALTCNPPDAG